MGRCASGSVNVETDGRDIRRIPSYRYEPLNRLSTGVATGSSTYNLSFSYDRYGNMTCVTNGQTNGPCGNWAFNTGTNQLSSSSGCTYDAAGNLTTDCSNMPAHTYQWDAEGRVASVDSGATWSFTYNALGERVQWAYSNGAGTNEDMFDPAGNWLGINGVLDVLRWGDRAFAWYTGTETYFNQTNNVSSTTVLTNHAGTPVEDALFYPWGQAWQSWGGGGANFTELPYGDGNTNTNLTMFRLQSPGLGRWHSPDPMSGAFTNPQSLNRYAYVLNNPTTRTDPLGLSPDGIPNSICISSYEGSYEPYIVSGDCDGSTGNPPVGPPDVTITTGTDFLSSDLAAGEAGYIANNCIGCFSYGSFTFSSLDNYFDWRTDLAALPQPYSSDIAGGVQDQADALAEAIAANCGGSDSAQKDCAAAEKALSDASNDATKGGFLYGGNFNFEISLSPDDLACNDARCNGIHIKGGYVHLDTANPYSDLLGLVAHAVVDGFLGHYVYSATPTPRPWP